MVDLNGVIYTYAHNYQGDIIGILDSTGAAVVKYYYDAWGRQYKAEGTLKDSLGKLNPFRYRGYVYDEETGLYYLRSRYYNPEWGRFINADTLLGLVGAIDSHNLFAYCNNSPSGYADSDGNYASDIQELIPCTVLIGYACVVSLSARSERSRSAKNSSSSAIQFKDKPTLKDSALVFLATTVALITAGARRRLTRALQEANIANAKDVSSNKTRNVYYFAYLPSVNGSSPLFIVNYPLTKDQAMAVLTYNSIPQAVMNEHNISAGMIGIYTPTDTAARSLAEELGILTPDNPHGKSKTIQGDYYHHDPDHLYHIWYDLPV